MVEAIACKEDLAFASDLVLRDFRLSCDNAEEYPGRKHGLLWTSLSSFMKGGNQTLMPMS